MDEEKNAFEQFGFNKYIMQALADSKMFEPTEIQAKSLPSALAGQDILGIAQTGTGKTAAYLLPIIYHLKYHQPPVPRALILVPTRELAVQVLQHFEALAKYTTLKAVALYGGLGPKTQKELLSQATDVIIATPGRLLELYREGYVILKKIKHWVLDEADRMMDMGFMPQIRSLLEILPVKRQNMLFSATFPDKVARLSEEFLEFPIRVEVSPQATVKDTLQHALYMVPNMRTKCEILLYLLKKLEEGQTALVFARSKKTANDVTQYLANEANFKVRALHGNLGQNTRLNVINELRSGMLQVVVATDVAARGLDIQNIELVINFDVPLMYEDYVHRIGRTGRMHKTGYAYTFATEADMLHIKKIENIIRQSIPIEPIPPEVTVHPTPFEERQMILKELDAQRKKADPNFKGAFHEKKAKNKPKSHTSDTRKARSKKRGR